MQNWYNFKNAKFDADFESIDKIAKNSSEKNYQQKCDRKVEFLTFYCVQKLLA
jgi:hypothetical protein